MKQPISMAADELTSFINATSGRAGRSVLLHAVLQTLQERYPTDMNAEERTALADTSATPLRYRLDTLWVRVYQAVFPGDVMPPDDPGRPLIADEMRDVHWAASTFQAAQVIAWWG